jgi:hypothetical protein
MAAAAIEVQVTPRLSPPGPPSPSQDTGLIPKISPSDRKVPSPPAGHTAWDPSSIEPETAMKMLARAVQALVNITGDVPPTPPLVRPPSPRQPLPNENGPQGIKESRFARHHRRTPSTPGTPVPDRDIKKPDFRRLSVGQPEADPHELSTGDIGANAEPLHLQQLTIARKFFCKTPPPVSLELYLTRLQRYCPMSTAVYLAAGSYIHKLCIEDKLVPATSRTAHRLLLASLRVAMKALEDLRYPQERFAIVGGVRQEELRALEISLCYLTDFELQVDPEILHRRMGGLLQAAGMAAQSPVKGDDMKLRLPMRFKSNVQV